MFSETSAKLQDRDFLDLNKELGDKVKSLILDVDTIISNQEGIMRTPKMISSQWLKIKSKLNSKDIIISESSAIQSSNQFRLNDEYSSDSFTGVGIFKDDEIKNESKTKYSTNETIMNFLKAQIIKHQADLKFAQRELKKKDERCKELELDKKKIEEKQNKLENQIVLQKETIIKANAMNFELQSKVHNQGLEINCLRKEIEGLNKDVKALSQLANNSDIRLNRSLGENEKLKSIIKNHDLEEKELRDQFRKIQEEKRISLKNLERQREEILQAFKKQTLLVDILKRQKAYLEASKEIQFVEEDFAKLLDWQPDKI